MLPDFNALPFGVRYMYARRLLMTGDKATPPKHRAILKTLGRLKRGDLPGTKSWGPWRAARAIKHDPE